MEDENEPAQDEPLYPTTFVMSEAQTRALAAQQHLLSWLLAETRRLEAELAYVRGAAQQAQQELHTWLAFHLGIDAAHSGPLTIDLERHIIRRQPLPAAADPTGETPQE